MNVKRGVRCEWKGTMKAALVGTTVCLCVTTTAFDAKAQEPVGTAGTVVATRHFRTFNSPERAGDALVAAAAQYDVDRLEQLFGPAFHDVVLSGDDAQTRQRLAEFVARAGEKTQVAVDPKTHSRAYVLVGNDEWQFPIPIVRHGGRWLFDTETGRQRLNPDLTWKPVAQDSHP
jgi:DUF2950 family protein